MTEPSRTVLIFIQTHPYWPMPAFLYYKICTYYCPSLLTRIHSGTMNLETVRTNQGLNQQKTYLFLVVYNITGGQWGTDSSMFRGTENPLIMIVLVDSFRVIFIQLPIFSIVVMFVNGSRVIWCERCGPGKKKEMRARPPGQVFNWVTASILESYRISRGGACGG